MRLSSFLLGTTVCLSAKFAFIKRETNYAMSKSSCKPINLPYRQPSGRAGICSKNRIWILDVWNIRIFEYLCVLFFTKRHPEHAVL